MSEPVSTKWLVALLLSLFLAQCVLSIQGKSITYDEPQHFRYGVNLLLDGDTRRFDDSKMAISALNAIPRALGVKLDLDWLSAISTGRYITMLVALLLGYSVFCWSRDLFGGRAGLLSLFLFAFSPNLIAHARLITTDVYIATAITVSLYCFWRFLKQGSTRMGVLSAITLGVAQITKYTAVFLFPIFALIALIFFWPRLYRWLSHRDWGHLGRAMGFALVWLIVYGFIILCIINAAYLFEGSFVALSDYRFQSSLFQAIQAGSGWLGQLPVPLPRAWLQGLDMVVFVDANLFTQLYLLGENRPASEPFKLYYFVAYLFKEPLAAQLLILAALLVIFIRMRERIRQDFQFLIVPVAFFVVYFNFMFHTQIGIRFLLMVLPLLYVLCGCIACYSSGLKHRLVLLTLISWQVVSVLSWFPHYIPYFNELTPDRKQAYRVLADSNINFGQSAWALDKWLAENPDARYQPHSPVSGRVVVDVNVLNHIFPGANNHWLRDNFEPIEHIDHSYLVFDISKTDYQTLLREQAGIFPEPNEVFHGRNIVNVLHNWQAKNLEREGAFEEAAIHVQRQAERSPFDADIYQDLERLAAKASKPQEIIDAYQSERNRILGLEALYQRSLKFSTDGDQERAFENLTQLSQQQPGYKLADFYLGLSLQFLGRHKQAIPFYRRFENQFPAYFQNQFNLAFALMQTGDCAGAIEHFERALKVKPDYQEARLHIAYCTRQ